MSNRNNRQQEQRTELHVQETRTFVGPLPPAEMLAHYDAVLPGAADRIITMAESQQFHRQKLELSVVQSNSGQQRMGTILGFIIAMTAIVGGIYLINAGKSATGITSIVGALVALVAVFVYGKETQRRELANKEKRLPLKR